MSAAERFDLYLEHLSAGLGRADGHAGLRGYCTGLMLPLSRKSVEPHGRAGGSDACQPRGTSRCTISWPRPSGLTRRGRAAYASG